MMLPPEIGEGRLRRVPLARKAAFRELPSQALAPQATHLYLTVRRGRARRIESPEPARSARVYVLLAQAVSAAKH